MLKVNDNTRFKSKNKSSKIKISSTLKWFLAADITYNFALNASFILVITFLVSDKYAGSISWIAFLFGMLYVAMTLSTILTKKLLDKTNLVFSTLLGMAILILSTILIIFSTNLYIILIAMIIEGIGAGIWVPSSYAYYWKLTKPAQREAVSGYFNGIKSSVKAIAPLAGGWIAATFGILAPFYLKISLALISLIIYIALFAKIRHSN
jgi:MFS family permease